MVGEKWETGESQKTTSGRGRKSGMSHPFQGETKEKKVILTRRR